MSGEQNSVIKAWFEEHGTEVAALARELWEHPELPMEEYRACRQTAEFLRKNGFAVRTCHCKHPDREPNTVAASWGSGYPVVGIIGEYDALAGLGQEAVPHRAQRPGPGHGCGHCLTTPACAGAAVAAKAAMEAEGLSGTVRFFACPAEESGEGKVYMVKNGDFDGLDCCISWHPMGRDAGPEEGKMLAITSMNLEFFGKAAHASAMPEMGRSALDAAELTNIGVQYLREHIPGDVRIHYVYKAAGESANIVPDYAKLHYLLRARTLDKVNQVVERVKKIAQGAAMMTETEARAEVVSGAPETYIVHGFNRFYYQSASKIPPIRYTPEERAYAETLYQNVLGKKPDRDILPAWVEEPSGEERLVPASTDVGYLTRMVPVSRLFGLGILRDIPMHHWGVTSTMGMSIGHKAVLFAGQAAAQCIYDIMRDPSPIPDWKRELAESTRDLPHYQPVLPEKPEEH